MNEEDERFFNNLPVGYRFVPTDEELVSCYLKNKFLNHPIPFCRIRDENLYQCHPQRLAEKYELNKRIENWWYFFTGRTKKYANGERPDRTAGDGYWKPTTRMKVIRINGQKAAEKRALDYYEGKQYTKADTKTDWKMHEFVLCREFADSLSSSAPNNNTTLLDDCVLCKLYNKKYNAEEARNNNEDAIPADDSNTNQTPDTNNIEDEFHVDVEATTTTTIAADDDSNTNQAADTNYEDAAAETTTGDLNTITNQTTDIIHNNDEHISNQAQLVHYPTDYQWHPQLQAAADNNNNNNNNNYYGYPGHGIANNNNNYCYPEPGINQDVNDIYGPCCIPFGYDEQKPYDHPYQVQNNYWQSMLDQTDYNMMMGSSSNQLMPHSVELLSNAILMNGGPLDVQPFSSLPYHSPKRTRFGL